MTLRRPPSSALFPYTTLFRSAPSDARRSPPKIDRTRPLASRPWAETRNGRAQSGRGRFVQSGARRLLVLVVVAEVVEDRKSTRLNSSHMSISYAVFCLKKKKM